MATPCPEVTVSKLRIASAATPRPKAVPYQVRPSESLVPVAAAVRGALRRTVREQTCPVRKYESAQ